MTILKVINLKLIKDDKKFKLHITQIVKCGESELPSSIKHANMPIFILVNYLFLHSCLLENLAFSPEIVWNDFKILVYTQERALCTSIPIIIQPTLKLKRKKSNGFEQEANVMLYEPVPRPALALISTERQSTPLALDAGGRVEQPACYDWKWSAGWETLSISTRTWTTSGTQDKQAESVCRWVRPPEGDQIAPPFCKVSDKDVDKMLILVIADSLKMLGTSPFLMSLVATKNLPASSLSSTLKMSLPKTLFFVR